MVSEKLESRVLMSVSPVNTQVVVDRLQVKADFLMFRSDIAAGSAELLVDAQALKVNGLGTDATFVPLFVKLHSDVQSMDKQLKLDRLNEGANVLHDESVVTLEMIQFIMDKGNPTARAAVHQKLLADRVQLQNDEVAGLTARINTRESDYVTISTDIQNIVTAGDALSPSQPLQAALNKFATNRTTVLNTVTSDLQTLVADRTNLADALVALEA